MPKMLTSRKRRAARLLDIMAAWWANERVAAIAEKHGVSRQLIYRILSSVCCGWRIRRRERASRGNSLTYPLPESEVARARSIVEGRFFTRLTSKQRGAVAWRASGCDMLKTARRLGLCPSMIRDLLIAAHWRVDKLTWEAKRRCASEVETMPELGTGLMEIEDLLASPVPNVDR
jgi:hypothetical protein